MLSLRRTVLVMVGVSLLLLTTGCDPRTNNQGGGNLITAAPKLLEHRIGDLNPDEWQVLADNLPTLAAQFGYDLGGVEVPEITDDQAAAIVDFLDTHNITTTEDLQAAISAGQITEADIPDELRSLVPA